MTKPYRWEADCLSDDPFAGDFGGGGDSDAVLADKMVTNRKGGTCSTCEGPCEPGSRNRVRTEVYDGDMMRFRWCVHCCFAMAVYDRRDTLLEARIKLGQDRREVASNGPVAPHQPETP